MQPPSRTPATGDQDPHSGESPRSGPSETPDPPDPLGALRVEVASIREQPVADRVTRFEHANVVLAAALAELDEV